MLTMTTRTSLRRPTLRLGRLATFGAALGLLLTLGLPTASAQDFDEGEEAVGPSRSVMSPGDIKRLDMEWADKRMIKSIQKKGFLKENRHQFTLHTGIVPNDEFFIYVPVGLRYNYWFSEDISAEGWATYQIAIETGLEESLRKNSQGAFIIEVPQSLLFMAGANVTWSPLHGKFEAFDTVVGFDIYLAFGAAYIMTVVREAGGNDEAIEHDIGGNVGIGAQLYISDFLSLRLDYRQFVYPAFVGDVAHPAEFTIGVSFWTSAAE